MSAPVALIDANVLYDVVLRDLLMQLAVSGLFRARWTTRIADEWARHLQANRPDITTALIAAARACRARLINPALSTDDYLGALARHGLTATAAFLRQNKEAL